MANRVMIYFFLILMLSQLNSYAETTVNIISAMPSTPVRSDADINADFLQKLANYPALGSANVSVNTENGVVILIGTLKTEAAANMIIALAASQPGVRDVDTTQLTLTGGQRLTLDQVLNAKVIGSLVREKAFPYATIDTLPITVTTNLGIVYLKGEVDTQAQMIYAIKIAQMTPGVPRVISELAIKASTVNLP